MYHSMVESSRSLGTSSGPRIAIRRLGECRPPGPRRAHAHELFTVVYFERGGGWHSLGGERRPVHEGDLVTIPPGAAHDYGGPGAAGGVAVAFDPDAVAGGWPPPRRAAAGEHVALPPHARSQVRRLIDGLAEELRDRAAGFPLAARAQLTLLLVLLTRLMPDTASDPVLEDVLAVIEARFREPLSLSAVAAAVARSPRHLSRTVAGLTGKTVMQLIEERRMEEARRLLLTTEDKVDRIGYAAGYGDGSYFARRFRRAHGVSPSAWRELNR